ncbi:MAG: DUF2254 domain-containing protein [Spirochaetales bacterium]|nr:DUF2254 domain-containing protein [Spirochaetales bacterium]
MKKLIAFLDRLRSTYWFLPSLMTLGAIGLSLLMVALDQRVGGTPETAAWLYSGGPEGARTLLSTVAGSMITIGGVSFSITIVALSIASSQFGARLLDNFLRDTGTQVVLGTFVSTFIYCVLVLRTIRDSDSAGFVPHLSVAVGIALTIASIGVLVYFVHHASASIHAEKVVASVARELDRAIERLLPDSRYRGNADTRLRREEDIPEGFEEELQIVPDSRSGYLQQVDYAALLSTAVEQDCILRVEYKPGDFVPPDRGLVAVWPRKPLEEKAAEAINKGFVLGAHPSWIQDLEYAVNQLVAVAVRALSPGVNDPFLAMSCIDRLGAALVHIAQKSIPSSYRYDEAGRLRLVLRSFTFEGFLDTAFNQIRQNAAGNVAVSIRLLETASAVAGFVTTRTARQAIRRQADMIRSVGQRLIAEDLDRRELQARYQHVVKILDGG